jgi:hypothetical protein
MNALQILLTLGVAGILGFIFYWFIVVFKAGIDKTKEDINEDTRFK